MYLKVQLHWNVILSPESLKARGLSLQRSIVIRLLDDFAEKKATKDHELSCCDHSGQDRRRKSESTHWGSACSCCFHCSYFQDVQAKGEILEGVVHEVTKHAVFLRCGPVENVFLSNVKMPNYHFVAGENPYS